MRERERERGRERERERGELRKGELGKYMDAVITNEAVLDAESFQDVHFFRFSLGFRIFRSFCILVNICDSYYSYL